MSYMSTDDMEVFIRTDIQSEAYMSYVYIYNNDACKSIEIFKTMNIHMFVSTDAIPRTWTQTHQPTMTIHIKGNVYFVSYISRYNISKLARILKTTLILNIQRNTCLMSNDFSNNKNMHVNTDTAHYHKNEYEQAA